MDSNKINKDDQKQEIDLFELIEKIWSRKRLIFKVVGISIILALIVGFSLPKEYITKVRLAPESLDVAANNNLSGLAAMAGINLASNSTSDALSLDLYPDIVKSYPFLSELISTQVTPKVSTQPLSLFVYMDEYQKKVWFSAILGFPFKMLGLLGGTPDEFVQNDDHQSLSTIYILTREEERVYQNLSQRISVDIDKKTNIITVSVQMQDQMVSAQVTEMVMLKLQDYITTYRTQKAVQDLEFTQEVFSEAQQNYYKAQLTYATFEDANKHIISAHHRTEQERLKNEMNVAYNVYNTLAQKLEQDKLKVQERTPVYTVIEPARVPLRHSSPRKMSILICFVFLGVIGAIGWILFGDFFKIIKNKDDKTIIDEVIID